MTTKFLRALSSPRELGSPNCYKGRKPGSHSGKPFIWDALICTQGQLARADTLCARVITDLILERLDRARRLFENVSYN